MNVKTDDDLIPIGISICEDIPIKSNANIPLVVNNRVLNTLKRYSLDINQLFILLAMYDKAIDLLDVYDSDFSDRKVLIQDYQHLQIHGFIALEEGPGPLYKLDEKGKTFIQQMKVLFDITAPAEEKEAEMDLKKLAADYLELWPRMKLPSGVYARVSSVEIEKKLKIFLKTYQGPFKKEYGIKLTAEEILEATKGYIARYAKQSYNFMINSSYFIQKREKSSLADEIIAIKQGTIKPQTKWEKQV